MPHASTTRNPFCWSLSVGVKSAIENGPLLVASIWSPQCLSECTKHMSVRLPSFDPDPPVSFAIFRSIPHLDLRSCNCSPISSGCNLDGIWHDQSIEHKGERKAVEGFGDRDDLVQDGIFLGSHCIEQSACPRIFSIAEPFIEMVVVAVF